MGNQWFQAWTKPSSSTLNRACIQGRFPSGRKGPRQARRALERGNLNLKEVPLREALAFLNDYPIGRDEEYRGDIFETVFPRDSVRIIVNQHGERHSVIPREALAVLDSVLGDSTDLRPVRAQLLVKPFQERESVLAGGTIHLEESGKHRTMPQTFLERVTPAVGGVQPKERRLLANFEHWHRLPPQCKTAIVTPRTSGSRDRTLGRPNALPTY